VPKALFKPPSYLVKEWPEVFEDLYMSTMPIEYLHSIRLEFKNGRIWEINVGDQVQKEHSQRIADKLVRALHEYAEDVKRIEFKVDVEKLKKDIKKSIKDIF
jgi:hypothetical protein